MASRFEIVDEEYIEELKDKSENTWIVWFFFTLFINPTERTIPLFTLTTGYCSKRHLCNLIMVAIGPSSTRLVLNFRVSLLHRNSTTSYLRL